MGCRQAAELFTCLGLGIQAESLPDHQLQFDEWLWPAQQLCCKALLVKTHLRILCGSMHLNQALPALAT